LEDCLRSGRLGAILHFEGLDPIGSDIEMIEEYHRAGLRSAGLVWQRDNKLACAATSGPASSDCGLTPLGRRVVHECNRLGILIDLSHINEAGFKDVAGVSDAPLVATHSNAYVLSPHSRNLKDYQLDAIRDSGGIVGVTFCVLFLRDDLEPSSDTPVETIVRHIDYIASRIGFEHVGLGSDFDGTLVPNDIGDATGFPVVVEALRRHGLSEADLARATHGNWARVLRATWKTEPGTRAECLPRSSPAQAQASGEGMYNA
ncbi:MAG: hypothetical protein HON70_42015, partial [Lentisphaerae bacterium]|nr:hypothetical protein [Lentisphaerota bacterium]